MSNDETVIASAKSLSAYCYPTECDDAVDDIDSFDTIDDWKLCLHDHCFMNILMIDHDGDALAVGAALDELWNTHRSSEEKA